MVRMDALTREVKTEPKVRRSRLRLLLRILNIAGIVLSVLVILQLLVLPSIVRRQVAVSLESLGLETVHFKVEHASIWGADISNLTAGEPGRANVNHVSVSYSP